MRQAALVAGLALSAQAAGGQTHFTRGGNKMSTDFSSEARPTILLIHGGFVDGSGWEGVYKRLRKDGYSVTIVQNPTISLNDDVAVTRRAIDAAGGPVILVGHSYGGVVVTEAGNDSRVVGLVYIAAFAPDNGESVGKLIANPAPGAPVPPILPPKDGFLALDRAKFAASFAADVDPAVADFMAASQVPWGLDALNGAVTEASWKTKPSWYLVAQEDKMIPPPVQRQMAKRAGATVAESPGSHSVYVSHPDAVAKVVERAAMSIAQTAATR
jgi:pimeloyl-ACP methyl ester carboxylesterase